MIGISTSAGPRNYWDKWAINTGLSAVEIDFSWSYILRESEVLVAIRNVLSKLNLSAHSTANTLFTNESTIARAEQEMLKCDVVTASLMGSKEVIFHLPNNMELNVDTVQQVISYLSNVIDLASKHNIKLLLENNSKGTFADAQNLLLIFNALPDLLMCLDIGHLHKAQKDREIEFIKILKEKIRYCHVHDNDGTKDSHSALGDGNINYKHILNFIANNTKVEKYIIETRDQASAMKTAEVLNMLGIT